eukprot:CAMPEP_0118807222 /NCGR_PEP_ID=MMETSP1161-20130426/34769_1 /TAXON_ID=249345 /ORGANISM="Picochlorum oklahomensis, Strain CCMP2329" /LENGTH=72 /DNA_ID=CAMNT_0006736555 /DNA_START=81 /DNA_END=296 /DNA_ORIENTATION=-
MGRRVCGQADARPGGVLDALVAGQHGLRSAGHSRTFVCSGSAADPTEACRALAIVPPGNCALEMLAEGVSSA